MSSFVGYAWQKAASWWNAIVTRKGDEEGDDGHDGEKEKGEASNFWSRKRKISLPDWYDVEEFVHAAADPSMDTLKRYYRKYGSAIVEATNGRGKKALYVAIDSYPRSLQAIRYLVETCGANINSVGGKNDHSAFYLAAACGNVQAAQYFVKRRRVDVEATDSGFTALHAAAFNGNLNVVQFLVEKCQANVHAVCGSENWTLLHSACDNNHVDVVRYLIEVVGVKVNVFTACGFMELHQVARQQHLETMQYLVRTCSVRGGDVNYVNTVDDMGKTALHYVCDEDAYLCTGLVSMLECLVEVGGAHIDARDMGGRTPLYYSVKGDHHESTDYLLDHGANVHSVATIDGFNALHVLCQSSRCRMDLLERLVNEFRVDIEARDEEGWTALHHASEKGLTRTVRHLVTSVGADTSATDSEGRTPLHLACFRADPTRRNSLRCYFPLVLFLVECIAVREEN